MYVPLPHLHLLHNDNALSGFYFHFFDDVVLGIFLNLVYIEVKFFQRNIIFSLEKTLLVFGTRVNFLI